MNKRSRGNTEPKHLNTTKDSKYDEIQHRQQVSAPTGTNQRQIKQKAKGPISPLAFRTKHDEIAVYTSVVLVSIPCQNQQVLLAHIANHNNGIDFIWFYREDQ